MSDGSTGRIVGAVAGAALAYFTGGASYVLTGAALGSAVGGMFDKTKTEGPRLNDLSIQQSNYGVGIPTLYGTERITPNVMWSTNKLELPFTSSQGKGGGVENTSYRYFVHMRHILCETPRDGSTVTMVKILQDGKLIWDASSGIPVSSALASAENLYASFILYQGHQDQMPNPEEEAWLGVGNVPAYRGVVSIYMRAIECPGGRVPQFSFVLSTTASVGQEVKSLSTITDPISANPNWEYNYSGICGPQTVQHFSTVCPGGGFPSPSYELGANYVHLDSAFQAPYPSPLNADFETPLIGSHATPQSVGWNSPTGAMAYYLLDQKTGARTLLNQSSNADGRGAVTEAAYDTLSGRYAIRVRSDTTVLMLPENVFSPVIASATNLTHGVCYYNSELSVAYHPTASTELRVRTSSFIEGVWTTISDVSIETPVLGSNCLLFRAGDDLFVRLTRDGSILRVRNGVVQLMGSYPLDSDPYETTFYADSDYAILGPFKASGVSTYRMVRFNAVILTGVKSKDIIADQCERVGNLTYEVSAIPDSDTVIGYELKGPASARTNIDPLLTCFGIYAVDEDGATKFKKLSDITSVATVTFDELGQTEGDVVDAMPLARTQEIDLPRSVTVNYVEPLNDYQTASETSVRQVTEATEDVSIDLPMAISSDQAKTAAEQINFARWRSQNTRTCSVSRKFAFVSPGDGVTIEYPRGTLRMWRVMSANDTGALCEWSLEPADSQLFTQIAIGATGYVPQQVEALAPPADLVILDTSILQDSDNDAGPYVAMSGYGSGWPGGELLVGNDETSLASRGTVENEAAMGFTETVLGAWSSNVVDESNLVTVNVGHFSLSSVTRDVLLGGTSNVAAIGAAGRWEIIKFQRADSLGSGRYVLSGLLRGVRGTEWAAGLHQANDSFVLLSLAGMLRPTTSFGEIGQAKVYEAITKGRAQSSATVRNYANTGEGLKPFAPVNLRKSLNGTDIVLTWSRRTRLSENAFAGILPLGETTEAYGVSIFSDSTFTTVKRVIAAYSETATYTAADQITDFGATQTTLYVRVQQRSDSIGLGHELQATL